MAGQGKKAKTGMERLKMKNRKLQKSDERRQLGAWSINFNINHPDFHQPLAMSENMSHRDMTRVTHDYYYSRPQRPRVTQDCNRRRGGRHHKKNPSPLVATALSHNVFMSSQNKTMA